jgi:signal transduction histidine kinase
VLVQIFSNLISNSLKFVPPGRQPVISISSRSSSGMVEVSVKDNGIGIPPEDYEKIFDVFERAAKGKRYPGAGLGLAIVKKAVERLEGEIRLESRVNEGTTFVVSLKNAAPAPKPNVPVRS